MEMNRLKQIIEGAVLAADEPLTLDKMLGLFSRDDQVNKEQLRAAIAELQTDFADRGIHLKEVASGFRFQVNNDLAPWIKNLWHEKPPRYSRAAVETLALIAYRQPITRGEIEDVRGVVVSTNIIRMLIEHEWIKVVGHRDVPGRPSLFATTKKFLDAFNLKTLAELPSLPEIKDMDQLAATIEASFEDAEAPQQFELTEAEVETETEIEIETEVEDLVTNEQE